MKIYLTSQETAQEVIGNLRNYGEPATLLSWSAARSEAIVVVQKIPAAIEQWVKSLATRIVEDK